MEAVLTHTRRVWEKRRIEPLGALCGGWKEWGVRVEGLMAHRVGADQEQKWRTKDPWQKEETARRSGKLNNERCRALLFILEARRIVGCSSFASSGVRATLGTNEKAYWVPQLKKLRLLAPQSLDEEIVTLICHGQLPNGSTTFSEILVCK